jgi:hypothetical protein
MNFPIEEIKKVNPDIIVKSKEEYTSYASMTFETDSAFSILDLSKRWDILMVDTGIDKKLRITISRFK